MIVASAGRRFIESEQYRSAKESGVFVSNNHPIPDSLSGLPLMEDTHEIVRALKLRTYSDLNAFDIDGVPYVGEAPSAAILPQAVETIPTEALQVYSATETLEGQYAAGVKDGQPYLEVAMDFTGGQGGSATAPTLQKLCRFGIAAPVALSVLDDPGQTEALINRRIRLSINLGLENEMLNGGQLMGAVGTSLLTQAAAPGSPVAKGSSYRAFAIRNAVADVQDAGWYERPLQVVINPLTYAALFEEEDGSQRPLAILEMFDDTVDTWIVSNKMTVGEGLVGDLFNAVSLHVKGPLTVGFSRNHMDFAARGLVMMTIGFRAFADVRQPDGLCLVTGIS